MRFIAMHTMKLTGPKASFCASSMASSRFCRPGEKRGDGLNEESSTENSLQRDSASSLNPLKYQGLKGVDR